MNETPMLKYPAFRIAVIDGNVPRFVTLNGETTDDYTHTASGDAVLTYRSIEVAVDVAARTSGTVAVVLTTDGYDKRTKTPTIRAARPMTREEARALQYGRHASFLAKDGTIRTVKVNGAPKSWKRDPSRVEVPVKYGLYEYATFCARPNGTMSADNPSVVLLIPLELPEMASPRTLLRTDMIPHPDDDYDGEVED